MKGDPAIALKRQLWAQLLKLVYGREVESDQLFFQHTFLVIVAKAIALAVLGLREDDPARVLSGAAFEAAGIFGAAESDFFDWVVAEPEGERSSGEFWLTFAASACDQVESDVLKILYELLIDREERHGLGEYYTPDWLAAKIVRHAVERPHRAKGARSGLRIGHLPVSRHPQLPQRGRRSGPRGRGLRGRRSHEPHRRHGHSSGCGDHRARDLFAGAGAGYRGDARARCRFPSISGDALQLSTATTMHLKELVIRVPPPPEGADLKFPEIFCKDIRSVRQAGREHAAGLGTEPRGRQIEPAFKLEVERHYKRD